MALAQSSATVTPGGNGSPESAPYGGSLLSPLSPSDPCAFGQPTCVLTGQYNRFRTSTNTYDPTLAGLTSSDSFSATKFLQFDTADVASGFAANPTMAQPLYVNNVTISGTAYEILIAANLNGSIYAFNVANGNALWKRTPSSTGNLWPLYGNCSPNGNGSPQAFVPDTVNNIGVFTLPYYGIVSSPVIDLSQTTPVLYTVSACIPDNTSANRDKISWYLNAIDVTTGLDLISSSNHPSGTSAKGGFVIAGTNGEAFNGGFHMQRPSLLFTNPSSLNYYLYASFGTGVFEIDSNNRYHGWTFGYKIAYGSSPFSATPTLLGPSGGAPFSSSSSKSITSVFPATANDSIPSSPLANPAKYPSCNIASSGNTYLASNCFHGDNWVGTGASAGTSGGIWMSGKGPASDSSGNVYFTAGNGPFDCTGSTSCTDPTQVLNWGESAIQLPPGSNTSPMAPSDFYTPWTNNYSNDSGPSYQYQALNRYDLDFSTPGVVLFDAKFSDSSTKTFSVTADKTGYVYAMPLNTGSIGMGRFRSGDSWLTSGVNQTQAPFRATRAAISSTNCPSAVGSTYPGYFNNTSCDEIHELAWWKDLLFSWPWNEAPQVYKGTPLLSGSTYTYSFSSFYNPCTGTTGIGTSPCSNTNFPVVGYPGGIMALAADSTGSTPKASLWAITTAQGKDDQTKHTTGTLYSYTVSTTGTALTKLFNGLSTGYCSGAPSPLPLIGWTVSPFAEPTLAHGKVYVPVYYAQTAGPVTISGILVFGKCS